MHGARMTRTWPPSRLCRAASNAGAPASSQLRLSHTRTVSGGGGALVVHDDVEMGVERGDLVDLDQGEPHLLGERRHVARVQAAEMILQQVQMLDQQVAPAIAIAEQGLDLVECRWIDLPALGMVEPAPSPGARMNAAVMPYGLRHDRTPSPSPPLRGEREGPARSAGG